MGGIVGVVANDQARYSYFTACLTGLEVPEDTRIEWAFGSDRIVGRNKIVRSMLNSDAEWLLFLDDDQAFAPDLLLRLLSHNQDVVAGLYTQRVAPFAPIMYDKRRGKQYVPVVLPDHPNGGLVPIVAAGTGAMLIRRAVLEAMADPWFAHGEASEDLLFCSRALDLGVPIYGDLDAQVGHMMTIIIRPVPGQEGWGIGLQIGETFQAQLPIEKPTDYERIASAACDEGAIQKVEEFAPLLEMVEGATTILEIGSGHGGSLAGLAAVAAHDAHLISVDLPNEQYDYGINEDEIADRFASLVGVQQTLTIIRGDSHDEAVWGQVSEALGAEGVDFLLIDGDHTKDGTIEDFNDYLEFVKPGGIIAIHDILGHPGVPSIKTHEAWAEIKAEYDGMAEEITDVSRERWGGFGIIRLPAR
jgi:predicted O-methyltransferase YrrM